MFVESGLKSAQGHLIITAIETQIQLLPSPFTVLRCVLCISSLFLFTDSCQYISERLTQKDLLSVFIGVRSPDGEAHGEAEGIVMY